MSLKSTYQNCKDLIAENLVEKGVVANGNMGLTTLANKILDIDGTSTTKNITIKAEFIDENNQDGLRPINLRGNLFIDDVVYETEFGPLNINLNNNNSWTYTIQHLPINHEYTINFDSISGYTINSVVLDNLITCTFTREVETTNVTAQAIFDDNNDSSEQRPSSVEVILFKNNDAYRTQTVNASNGWRCYFNDLPLNTNPTGESGGQIRNVYTVDTISTPEQYRDAVVTGSVDDGFRITFKLMQGQLEIRTTFSIDNGIDNEDPLTDIGNANFQLLGPDPRMPMNITYAHFTDAQYSLNELVPGAYAVICNNAISLIENAMLSSDSVIAMAFKVEDDNSATASLFLHYEPTIPYEEQEPEEELIDVSVIIIFSDQDNKDGNRPQSITVRLYAGGAEIDNAIVTASDGWTHTFSELPKYLDGNPIHYSITEDPVNWYSTNIHGFTITNNYVPEVTSVSVRKIWNDDNNESGVRPSSIAMTLNNGNHVILNEANGWTATISDLPTHVNGEEVAYSWTEQEVLGYMQQDVTQQGAVTIFTNALWTLPETPGGGKKPKS